MERFDLNAVIKGVLQSSDILIRQKEAKVSLPAATRSMSGGE